MSEPQPPASNPSPAAQARSWSLRHEVDAVLEEAVRQRGRVSRVLVKSAEVRVLIIGMAKGVTWPRHIASGRVVARVERGVIDIATTHGTIRAVADVLVTLDPGESHDVVAAEDSVFSLIVAG